MEAIGFIFLFMGMVYFIVPDINIRFSKDRGKGKSKEERDAEKKTMRLVSIFLIIAGLIGLWASYYLSH